VDVPTSLNSIRIFSVPSKTMVRISLILIWKTNTAQALCVYWNPIPFSPGLILQLLYLNVLLYVSLLSCVLTSNIPTQTHKSHSLTYISYLMLFWGILQPIKTNYYCAYFMDILLDLSSKWIWSICQPTVNLNPTVIKSKHLKFQFSKNLWQALVIFRPFVLCTSLNPGSLTVLKDSTEPYFYEKKG